MSRDNNCYLCGKIFRGGHVIKYRIIDKKKRKVHSRCDLKAEKVKNNGYTLHQLNLQKQSKKQAES